MPLMLSSAPEFQMEAFTSMDVAMPIIQQTSSPIDQTNVDLDVTLSNEDDIVPINLEKFNKPGNNTDEDAHDNRLFDI